MPWLVVIMLSIDSLNNMHIITYKSLDYVHSVFELELAPVSNRGVSNRSIHNSLIIHQNHSL